MGRRILFLDLTILVVIGVGITSVIAFYPPKAVQSFWVNVVWLDQFTDQLAAGYVYPRWLPDSHNGLGAPVFYFYPPIAFYLAAIPNIFGVPDYFSTIIAFGITSVASGITMYWWLKGAPQRLLGSALFMVLPYHLFDFFYRGALAEFAAIAFLPLLAIGLNKRPVVLALSYAGIIMTHLPLALLASVFLVAPYGLWLLRKDVGAIKAMALGLTAGLLLSSIYLYPALSLDEFRKADELYLLRHFQPASWNFFSPESWTNEGEMLMLICMTAATFIGSALLSRQGFWPVLAMLVCIIVSGAIGVWSVPLLAKVQFPWRALPIAEFALATAFAYTARGWLAPIAVAPALAMTQIIPVGGNPAIYSFDHFTETHRDVAEYLPAAVPAGITNYMEWAQQLDRPNDTFYFPSLGTSRDGVFLDKPPKLRTLPEEFMGLFLSLLGLFLIIVIAVRSHKHSVEAGKAKSLTDN